MSIPSSETDPRTSPSSEEHGENPIQSLLHDFEEGSFADLRSSEDLVSEMNRLNEFYTESGARIALESLTQRLTLLALCEGPSDHRAKMEQSAQLVGKIQAFRSFEKGFQDFNIEPRAKDLLRERFISLANSRKDRITGKYFKAAIFSDFMDDSLVFMVRELSKIPEASRPIRISHVNTLRVPDIRTWVQEPSRRASFFDADGKLSDRVFVGSDSVLFQETSAAVAESTASATAAASSPETPPGTGAVAEATAPQAGSSSQPEATPGPAQPPDASPQETADSSSELGPIDSILSSLGVDFLGEYAVDLKPESKIRKIVVGIVAYFATTLGAGLSEPQLALLSQLGIEGKKDSKGKLQYQPVSSGLYERAKRGLTRIAKKARRFLDRHSGGFRPSELLKKAFSFTETQIEALRKVTLSQLSKNELPTTLSSARKKLAELLEALPDIDELPNGLDKDSTIEALLTDNRVLRSIREHYKNLTS